MQTTHHCVSLHSGHLHLHTPDNTLAKDPDGGEECPPPPPHRMPSGLARSPTYKVGTRSAGSSFCKSASQGLVTQVTRSLPLRAGGVRLTEEPSRTAPPSKILIPHPHLKQELSPRPTEAGLGQMAEMQAPKGYFYLPPSKVPALQGMAWFQSDTQGPRGSTE